MTTTVYGRHSCRADTSVVADPTVDVLQPGEAPSTCRIAGDTRRVAVDAAEEASEESSPASDPPVWKDVP